MLRAPADQRREQHGGGEGEQPSDRRVQKVRKAARRSVSSGSIYQRTASAAYTASKSAAVSSRIAPMPAVEPDRGG
ncbi:MAG TPA: hypothetical protein VF548_09625 [Allosphingosinicella sp.]